MRPPSLVSNLALALLVLLVLLAPATTARGQSASSSRRPLEAQAAALAESGQPQQALEKYRQARAEAVEDEGEEHIDVARIDQAMGALLVALGRIDEAEKSLARARRHAAKTSGRDRIIEAQALVGLANVDAGRGRNERAHQRVQEALGIARDALPPGDPELAAFLWAAGKSFNQRSEPARAEGLLREGLKLLDTGGSVRAPQRIALLLELGHNRDLAGEPLAAARYLDEALDTAKRGFGEAHPQVAQVLITVGARHGARGEVALAETRLTEALAIMERAFGKEAPQLPAVLMPLLVSQRGLGKVDEALATAKRIVAITEKHYGPDHPALGGPLYQQARIHLDRKEARAAKELLERSQKLVVAAEGPNSATLANHLSELARAAEMTGEMEEAEQLFRRALALIEGARGRRDPGYAFTLFLLGSLQAKEMRFREARDTLEEALSLLDPKLSANQGIIASTLSTLGLVHQSLSELDAAETALLRALRMHEQYAAESSASVASALGALARLYLAKGDYQKAAEYNDRARAAFGDPERPSLELALFQATDQAAILVSLGRYEEAERAASEAERTIVAALGADSPHLANVYDVKAQLAASRGDTFRAEALLEEAEALLEGAAGPDTPDLVPLLVKRARLMAARASYEEAQVLLSRAREILEPHRPDGRLAEVALAQAQLGRLAGRDPAGAVELASFAAQILREDLGSDHVAHGEALSQLAVYQLFAGQKAEAAQSARESLRITRKVHGEEHPVLAERNLLMGMVAASDGKWEQADDHLRRAIELERKTNEKSALIGHALTLVAFNALAAGRLEAALEGLEESTRIGEAELARLLTRGAEFERTRMADTGLSTTSALLTVHLQKAPKSSRAADLAATSVLRNKNRALDASLQSLAALRRRLSPEDRELLDELAAVRTTIAELASQAPRGNAEAHTTRLREARMRGYALERKLAERSQAVAELAKPITVARVAERLPPHAALIELVVYDPPPLPIDLASDPLPSRYAAYVIRPDREPVGVDLGPAEAIDDAVALLRQSLADPKDPLLDLRARRLDELVTARVRPYLKGARHWFIAPDGQLHLVPFGALRDEEGNLLLSTQGISYLSSGRDLLRELDAPPRQAPLIVADPAFGDKGKRPTSGSRAIDLSRVFFSRLPGTRAEAEALGALLPNADRWVGEEAREGALKGITAPEILHIATHGFFLDDEASIATGRALKLVKSEGEAQRERFERPALLRSGLALRGANLMKDGAEDGILTALEASSLDLHGTKLVVLSACETGVGEVRLGQGVDGLRRALFIAGAETQVMSLWQVDDFATEKLMRLYYEGLARGEGRAEALRKAKAVLASDEETSHPYYWASFIVSGDPSSLEGAPPPPPEVIVMRPGCACRLGPAPSGDGRGSRWASLGALALALAALRRRRRGSGPRATPHAWEASRR